MLLREYYRSRQEMSAQNVEHELALRHSFQDLLGDSARLHGWTLIAELGAKAGGHTVRPDATLRDANSIPRGYHKDVPHHVSALHQRTAPCRGSSPGQA